MTYQEYINQKDPQRQPKFSVVVSEQDGNYWTYGTREYCGLGGHDYFVAEHGGFYTTDEHGNKSRSSVFCKDTSK